MILTIAAFLIPLILLIFADLEVYIATCAFMYGVLICYRYARKDKSILDIIFFFTYSTLALLQITTGLDRFIPYTGTVIYGVLAIVFFLASLGLPLTNNDVNTWKPEILLERRITNLLLAIMNSVAFMCSLVLFPSILYIIIPLVITVISIPVSIFLSPVLINMYMRIQASFYMSSDEIKNLKKIFGNIRGLRWVSDSLYAKEVMSDFEREMFFSVLARGYYKIYQKSQNKSKGTYQDFILDIKKEYIKYAKRSSSFIVYDTNTNAPVGCIRIVLGGPAHGGSLPLENFIPVSLSALGEATLGIAEIGRLVIIPSGPLKAKVLEILVSLMIVKALFSRVRVILTDAMEESVSLYEKMGLKRIAGPFYDTEFSQNTWLCAADMAILLSDGGASLWDHLKSSPGAKITIKNFLSYIQETNKRFSKKNKPYLLPGSPIETLIKTKDSLMKNEKEDS